MTSRVVYGEFRRHLSGWFTQQGFKRAAHTSLGWHRHGLLVWFQCDQRGWDRYLGSCVFVNFQAGSSDRAWDGPVQRLTELLTDQGLERFRSMEHSVTRKLRLPPPEHVQALRTAFAGSPDTELTIESYLAQFRPDASRFESRHDRALRYWDLDDIDRWSEFLLERLPGLLDSPPIGRGPGG